MSRILELYKELFESKQRFLDEVFEQDIYKKASPQLTIIDLGAYEGEFAFYCLNFAKKIYAIEPDPTPYKILQERVTKFELSNIIKTFPIAVAGKNGKRVLYASGAGGSALLADGDTEHDSEKKIVVPALTLKTFMKRNNINKVDILKIDVEAAEKEIFAAEDFPVGIGAIADSCPAANPAALKNHLLKSTRRHPIYASRSTAPSLDETNERKRS